MTIEIDHTTGLPKLPEGYFWRVKMSYNYPHVCIRRNVTLLGMKLWSYEVKESLILSLTESDIRREANKLYTKTFGTDVDRTLLGDYPPKKLGTAPREYNW
ncbi:hypothetical protein SEA_ATUIN_219 [Arthrobacter phage Atuin]|nr:hypothetical protein SEA_ATUIN_18 [Arthrobacter phage Atuin]